MQIRTLKRVTLVVEALIAEKLQADILRLGASGYTTTKAEGRGTRGVRANDWEGRNSKIETIVTPEVADAILNHLSVRYFEHYAVIAYAHDVDVVRGDKFV